MASKRPRFEEAERQKWLIRGAVATVGVGFSYLFRGNVYAQAANAALCSYLLTGNRYEWIYIFSKTYNRDYLFFRGVIRLLFQMWRWEKQDATVASVFSQVVARHADKPAFIMDDVVFTFRQGEELSNRVAWYFKRQGFKRGDAIALLMETKPEYVFIWIGLAKIGVVTALINTNVRGDGLLYCVKASNCKAVIFGDELINAIKDIQSHSELKFVQIFQFNTSNTETLENARLLSSELQEMPSTPLVDDIKAGHFRDKVLYIFTSGTTGLPKAAIVTNFRYLMVPTIVFKMSELTESDIVYDPLPLNHSAGGMLGAGQAVVMGLTVVLKKNFSASNYWKDCIKYNCTVAQYIGEICRYLVSVPPSEADQGHKVRVMVGNGLRAQIWQQLVDRFAVTRVTEFYGSTEGNCTLLNNYCKVGAVGFLPRAVKSLCPHALVRCDQVTGEILRDANGLCVECVPGEPGLLLGRINEKRALSLFAGYVDKTESEKKIVQNVFTKVDRYFNTGDILVMDHLGYFYFKDRTGDTFRWRGENVSTTEVESVITDIVGFTDVVVYGVTIPNTEGKAGMAAIVDPQKKVNIAALAKGLNLHLPTYARPIFLRIIPEVPITSTFKLKKIELLQQGFNMSDSSDDFYFQDPKSGEYVPLSRNLYDDIIKGKVRI